MNFFPILILVFSFNLCIAQSDTLSITLDEAINYGLKNRHDLKANQLSIDIAENDFKTGKHQILPEIKATGNVRYNTQLQTNVFPAALSGNPGGGDTRVKIGTKNNTTAALEFDQALYNPTFNSDLKVLKNEINISKKNADNETRNARYNISAAYYKVHLYSAKLKIHSDNMNQSYELATIGKQKYEANVLLENEYFKLILDYQRSKADWSNAKQDLLSAMVALKTEINFTGTEYLLTDNEYNEVDPVILEAGLALSFDEHYEIQKLQLDNVSYQLNYKKAELNILPSLSLFGNYATQYQHNDFNFSNDWNPYNYVGLKATLPIFSKLENTDNRRKYKLLSQQTQYKISDKKTILRNELNSLQSAYKNAIENLQYSKDNYDLARKIYFTDLEHYKLGKLNYNDLIDSLKNKNDAESDALQNTYNYKLTILDLEKFLE